MPYELTHTEKEKQKLCHQVYFYVLNGCNKSGRYEEWSIWSAHPNKKPHEILGDVGDLTKYE